MGVLILVPGCADHLRVTAHLQWVSNLASHASAQPNQLSILGGGILIPPLFSLNVHHTTDHF